MMLTKLQRARNSEKFAREQSWDEVADIFKASAIEFKDGNYTKGERLFAMAVKMQEPLFIESIREASKGASRLTS